MRSLKPRRWLRSPSALRTITFTVAFGVTALAFVSSKRSVRAVYTSGTNTVEASLHGGLIEFGWVDESSGSALPRPIQPAVSFDVQREWNDALSLAWRPYHVRQTRWPSTTKYHGLAIPLWILAVPSLLLAGYAHGLVAGLRRGTKGCCSGCGYPRSGLAVEAACPECGGVPAAAAA